MKLSFKFVVSEIQYYYRRKDSWYIIWNTWRNYGKECPNMYKGIENKDTL